MTISDGGKKSIRSHVGNFAFSAKKAVGMPQSIIKIVFTVLFTALFAPLCMGLELQTRYTTIVYDGEAQLKKFNKNLYMGRAYRRKNASTVFETVKRKVDIVVEKNEIALEMFPDQLRFRIILKASREEMRTAYDNLYGKKRNYIAFYSPEQNSVYILVKKSNLRVVAHEFAHAVINRYFDNTPSAKIHELLAQYAANRIWD